MSKFLSKFTKVWSIIWLPIIIIFTGLDIVGFIGVLHKDAITRFDLINQTICFFILGVLWAQYLADKLYARLSKINDEIIAIYKTSAEELRKTNENLFRKAYGQSAYDELMERLNRIDEDVPPTVN